MFTDDMIAPCGLDCSICSRAQIEDDPCPGCNGPDENKPDFCANRCGIILCRKRKDNGYTYCDECPDYPCEDVMEKENRYTTQYPLRESPLENLRAIREDGMELLCDPEWPNKILRDRIDEIRPCLSCFDGCMGALLTRNEITR